MGTSSVTLLSSLITQCCMGVAFTTIDIIIDIMSRYVYINALLDYHQLNVLYFLPSPHALYMRYVVAYASRKLGNYMQH